MRTPNVWEASLISLASQQLGEHAGRALLEQLRGTTVEADEQGQLRFYVPESARTVADTDVFPIIFFYYDNDGMPVEMLLHVNAATRHISSLERYRLAGGHINLLWPQLDQVRCSLHEEPGSKGIGWTIRGEAQ